MVSDGESLPPKTRRPLEALGHQVAVCQTFALARRYGWQVAVGVEDVGCPLALTAFGFKPETETFSCGAMCGGMFTKDNPTGARTEAEVPKFSFQQYKYVLAAPIERAAFEPHLYLVYGNSAQVMRLMKGICSTGAGTSRRGSPAARLRGYLHRNDAHRQTASDSPLLW
jgi:uncharacterized protein (DUF169 family)